MMYWTKFWDINSEGGIFKAEMDGTNAVEIVSGVVWPESIAIDFDSQRLFWTDEFVDKIQSSNLDGTDVQLVLQLSSAAGPSGIVVTDERIFWGNSITKSLQSSDKAGHDIVTLYDGGYSIRHLAIAPQNLVQTRPNHCEKQMCSGGVCVLNRNSFRCVV